MRQRTLLILPLAMVLAMPINAASPDEPSLSTLTRAGAEPHEPRRTPEPFAGQLLDALKHPDGDFKSSGWSTGPDYEQCSGQLLDKTPIADLLTHYAAQLLDAGWSPTFTHHDGPIALQGWRFTDSSARLWHALLLIEESSRSPGSQRTITLRLTRIAPTQS